MEASAECNVLAVHVSKVEFLDILNTLECRKLKSICKTDINREPSVALKIKFCPPVWHNGSLVLYKNTSHRHCRNSSLTAKSRKQNGKVIGIALLASYKVQEGSIP